MWIEFSSFAPTHTIFDDILNPRPGLSPFNPFSIEGSHGYKFKYMHPFNDDEGAS